MATTYTVDASVFLNAFNPYEDGHEESRRLLSLLQDEAVPIVVPTLLLPEVAAAVARGRGDPELARRFARALKKLPHLVLLPLDGSLAGRAADMAADYWLRGSDAVYAAVAERFGSTLVSLDREQRDRVGAVVEARAPAGALSEWSQP